MNMIVCELVKEYDLYLPRKLKTSLWYRWSFCWDSAWLHWPPLCVWESWQLDTCQFSWRVQYPTPDCHFCLGIEVKQSTVSHCVKCGGPGLKIKIRLVYWKWTRIVQSSVVHLLQTHPRKPFFETCTSPTSWTPHWNVRYRINTRTSYMYTGCPVCPQTSTYDGFEKLPPPPPSPIDGYAIVRRPSFYF